MKTYKGWTAKEIVSHSMVESDGRSYITIGGDIYTVQVHGRVELANGNWTSTVVIESHDMGRHVLDYPEGA